MQSHENQCSFRGEFDAKLCNKLNKEDVEIEKKNEVDSSVLDDGWEEYVSDTICRNSEFIKIFNFNFQAQTCQTSFDPEKYGHNKKSAKSA